MAAWKNIVLKLRVGRKVREGGPSPVPRGGEGSILGGDPPRARAAAVPPRPAGAGFAQTLPHHPLLKNRHFCLIECHLNLKAVIFNLTVFLISPSRKYVWDQLGNRGKKNYQKVFSLL